jgi:hypothetical protein
VLQRVQELHRPDQVRGDPVEHQAAFGQGLPDQPEVEHLQVPQAAVDELARPARGAAGPVAALDDRRGQAAGDGIESGTSPDHASAHDQDVQYSLGHLGDRVLPCGRG